MGEELDERTWRAAVSVLPPIGWQPVGGAMVGVAYRRNTTAIYTRRGGRFFLHAEGGRVPLADAATRVRESSNL
jgi:hypothetical protein